MLHARLELHGEVHECLPCDPGCQTCSLEKGCHACDAFYVALPDGAGCRLSWLRIIAIILIILLPIVGCTLALTADDEMDSRHRAGMYQPRAKRDDVAQVSRGPSLSRGPAASRHAHCTPLGPARVRADTCRVC